MHNAKDSASALSAVDDVSRTVKRRLRVLLVGPQTALIGGTTVAFDLLVKGLSKVPELDVEIVGLRGGSGSLPRKLLTNVIQATRVVRRLRCADVVMLNTSARGIATVGNLLLLLARKGRTAVIFRKFNGRDVCESSRWVARLALRALKRCDLYLAETKRLVERARTSGISFVEWYPNPRPMRMWEPQQAEPRCRRFIYLGQVRPEKGIAELLEASAGLPADLSVDIYGPLFPGVSFGEVGEHGRVQYCGVVESLEVPSLLRRYDALVLPTYWHGEGYPGVIIEAFEAGLPVICTRWAQLDELVDSEVGILVQPRNARELREAMIRLAVDSEMYRNLQAGALRRRSVFAADYWTDRTVELLFAASRRVSRTP